MDNLHNLTDEELLARIFIANELTPLERELGERLGRALDALKELENSDKPTNLIGVIGYGRHTGR